MIFFAIIIHLLGHLLPSWLTKRKIKDLRSRLKWKQVFYEMSGTLLDFSLAFLIILSITLSTKEKYLLNENAIYGAKVSNTAYEIGFRDGDKIVSINEKQIIKFDDIVISIIREPEPTIIQINRNDVRYNLKLHIEDKLKLIKDSAQHFKPLETNLNDNSDNSQELYFTESNKDISDAVRHYISTIKYLTFIYSPQAKKYEGVGGFIRVESPTSIRSFLGLLSINLIFIGLINFLPFPGLDLGNSIIKAIENIRRENFKYRLLQYIRTVGLFLFIVYFIVFIYFGDLV